MVEILMISQNAMTKGQQRQMKWRNRAEQISLLVPEFLH
jgi:hypothetical protein